MAANKTVPTEEKIEAYIKTLPNERKQNEAYIALNLIKEITGRTPRMWGPSIIGFDEREYKHGKMPLIAFSPRKTNFVFYIINDSLEQADLLAKLGKYRTGKVCLYINKLADINIDILEQLLRDSWIRRLKIKTND